MIIALLTDPHIGMPGENPFDIDVRNNFTKVLANIREEKVNLIVLAGDTCFRDPNQKIYKWAKKQLENTGIEYTVLAGNHDDLTLMQQASLLPQTYLGTELYYKIETAHHTLFFLDSSTGVLSKEQLSWLKKELSSLKINPILFMHHPPCLAGVPHMDKKWALSNISETQALLTSIPKQIPIFCGHYHVEKSILIKNLNISITPSTFFQVSQTSQVFKIDSHRIGWRKIELLQDTVRSTVRYL